VKGALQRRLIGNTFRRAARASKYRQQRIGFIIVGGAADRAINNAIRRPATQQQASAAAICQRLSNNNEKAGRAKKFTSGRPCPFKRRSRRRGSHMLMNKIEYWGMNNPLRAFVQRHYEAPRLMRLVRGKSGKVLEIGCGQGTGARIIFDLLAPEEYLGIDLDPRMIRRARKRAGKLPNARFVEGDVSSLELPDGSFDLVVNFAMLHHVPDWRSALAEIHRILKVGGEFLFEDLPAETWERGLGIPSSKIADHPYDRMFRKHEFVDELATLGCKVEVYENRPLSLYHFWGRAKKIS
jgi:ubiquinone/menaquinone biosynthesis C-methylase UbiE